MAKTKTTEKPVTAKEDDSRYPYTYAADCIRIVAGHNRDGSKISRSDAAKIRALFVKVTGVDDETLAKMLADHYQKYIKDLEAEAFRNFMAVFNKEKDAS
jgi:hypothetical protein